MIAARSRSIAGLALVAAVLCPGCASNGRRFPAVEVSPGLFEGPKPYHQAQFAALKEHGVRTILSLERLPWDIWLERWQARRNGLHYVNVPILASPLPPRDQRVKEALLALNNPSLRPVFVHCFLGEDRDIFIVGLYRIYFQDWTPQAAWEEMLRSGFHSSLRLLGFKTYFWHHTRKPDWVKAVRRPELALRPP